MGDSINIRVAMILTMTAALASKWLDILWNYDLSSISSSLLLIFPIKLGMFVIGIFFIIFLSALLTDKILELLI